MQLKRILGLAFVLSLVFVLAACNAGAATPAPESTEPASGGSVDLPESASVTATTGGTLTVNYPSGWTATPTDGTGTIALVGSEPTQIGSVTYYDTAMGADAATVIGSLSTGFTAAGGTASDVTESEVNGRPAASVTVTTAAGDTTYLVVTL